MLLALMCVCTHVCTHTKTHTYIHTQLLTYIGPTQGPAQRPGSDVRHLVVDGHTLNTSDEASVGPCRSDQPVDTRGPAHIQRRAEGDLGVLALQEQG